MFKDEGLAKYVADNIGDYQKQTKELIEGFVECIKDAYETGWSDSARQSTESPAPTGNSAIRQLLCDIRDRFPKEVEVCDCEFEQLINSIDAVVAQLPE